jgi:hypothetical protein
VSLVVLQITSPVASSFKLKASVIFIILTRDIVSSINMFYIGSLSGLSVFVHRILLSSILLTSLDKYKCDEYGDLIFIGYHSDHDSHPGYFSLSAILFPLTSEMVLLITDPDI